MYIILTLLVAAGCLITSLFLIRKWELEKIGIDIEYEDLNPKKLHNLDRRQKFILALLIVPAVLFLFLTFLYLLTNVLVVAQAA